MTDPRAAPPTPDQLQAQITTINGQISTINTHLSALDSMISQISTNFTNLDNQISTINTHLTTIDNQISTITTRLNTIDGKISTINTHLSTIDGQITTIMQMISDLASAGAENTADIAAAQTQYQDFRRQVMRLDTPAGQKIDEIYNLLTHGTPDEWVEWREAPRAEFTEKGEET